MAKQRQKFVCANCAAETTQWMGRCSACGEWNSFIEQTVAASASRSTSMIRPLSLQSVLESSKNAPARYSTGMITLDQVLGGGLVPGSVNLLSGAPGMGKSTLLLQIAHKIAVSHKVLYVSGEEAVEQVALRAVRLGTDTPNVSYAYSTDAAAVASAISSGDYALVIVDSIQVMRMPELSASPGGVAQITSTTHALVAAAKPTLTAVLIVGQITKEGSIAGPKLLEHMVDSVLHLEGDPKSGFKVMRASKNRFGTIEESALFIMTEQGLQIVDNPSAELLKERRYDDGSVVTCIMQGTKPLLIEVQALVNRSPFGYAKRAVSGFDSNRLHVLIALLEKRTKLQLSEKDIYVNIVGGIKASEPAVDLAVCMAIASADKGMRLKTDAVVFGEVGLGGEVRRVSFVGQRAKEASKMGFKAIIGPSLEDTLTHYSSVGDVKTALNQYLTK